MKELSLHILDLVQNSVAANASLIEVNIKEDLEADWLVIEIIDNGKGMDKDFLEKVRDPFVTTRTTRKVGLGISLIQAACERCEGVLDLASEPGIGTRLAASFRHGHIDRAPLGNMADTMVSILLSCNEADIKYTHTCGSDSFCFDTREVKEVLGEDVSLSEPDILSWARDYINEGLAGVKKN